MPWPESWPIRGEDVAFADSAATRKEGGLRPPPHLWEGRLRRPSIVADSIEVDGATYGTIDLAS